MKITSVQIKNFGLMRDVNLEFSTQRDKPLTVIRGENASGKTTLLDALRWGLYGSKVGLGPRRDRQIGPSDTPVGETIAIKVTLDLQTHHFGGDGRVREENYRLVRSANETAAPDGYHRDAESVALYRLTDGGAEPVANPSLIIEQSLLPAEQKDVFLTDGDSALAFISDQVGRGDKRTRVESAIRSLLGLEVLEAADEHLKTAEREFRQKAAGGDDVKDLTQLNSEISDKDDRLEELNSEIDDLEGRRAGLEQQHREVEKELEDALKAGDEEKLAAELNNAERSRKGSQGQIDQLKLQQRDLFRDEALDWSTIGPALREGYEVLTGLKERGVIPRNATTYLQERLEAEVCICGTELAPGSAARTEVEHLLEAQKTVDSESQELTELMAAVAADIAAVDAGKHDWTHRADRLTEARIAKNQELEAAERWIAELENDLAEVEKGRVQEARSHRDAIRQATAKVNSDLQDAMIEARQLESNLNGLRNQVDAIIENNNKLREWSDRLRAAEDLRAVVTGTLQEIQEVHVERVSDRMNEIFTSIIGADTDNETSMAGAVSGASVSADYDIVVHTKDGADMDPAELNGAAQRVLTFAFIWSLAEVSGEDAPRIIDTPLGMMAGTVKRATAELVGAPPEEDEPDRQVVLMLTRSEIAHIEDILDASAGKTITITNTSHYPRILAHDPNINRAEIRVCDCSHRESCPVCARIDDEAYDITFRARRTNEVA